MLIVIGMVTVTAGTVVVTVSVTVWAGWVTVETTVVVSVAVRCTVVVTGNVVSTTVTTVEVLEFETVFTDGTSTVLVRVCRLSATVTTCFLTTGTYSTLPGVVTTRVSRRVSNNVCGRMSTRRITGTRFVIVRPCSRTVTFRWMVVTKVYSLVGETPALAFERRSAARKPPPSTIRTAAKPSAHR